MTDKEINSGMKSEPGAVATGPDWSATVSVATREIGIASETLALQSRSLPVLT